MAGLKVRVKEEPPDDHLTSILENDIQLTSVDKESEGLITQQIEEILPSEGETEDEEEEEKKEGQKKKLRCRICDFKTNSKKCLKRHEDRHSIKGWYHECQYCEYVTYIRQRLIEHESKHTNTKPFECEKCEFRTRFKADLYKHKAKHSTVKKYSCTKCDFRTKWRRNIQHHLLKHSDERPHGCHICGFKFKRIQDLKYHLYRHNDLKPIQCDECDFRCKTNYELKCHRLKHSDVKNFACTFPGCLQRTKTKSDLTKHMRTHNKENSYLCSLCGKGFKTMNSLNKHKERHTNVRKFKCALCDKWFKTKPSLRSHMKIHSGIKPFQCDICFKYFLNKFNMFKHKETHEGDRPYLCPICPYGARTSEHLLAHIGSMHGDSHAYFCELCRKPFKRYSQLQVHIKRMHKGVESFDRTEDGKLDIKLEPGEDGEITTGNDIFSVKKIGECHFEPEVKRKRGRPPKKKPSEESELSKDDPLTITENVEKREEVEKGEEVKKENEVSHEQHGMKLATYKDGFRLPLASKGFLFNFDKTGKKPKSWFMQPENMHGRAAAKQRAYMAKKERYYNWAHNGRVKRARKKPESDSEPQKILAPGRSKLKTMRKIKRRIRRMNTRMNRPLKLDNHTQDNSVQNEEIYSTAETGSQNRKQVDNPLPQDNHVTEVTSIQHVQDEDDLPLSKLKENVTLDSENNRHHSMIPHVNSESEARMVTDKVNSCIDDGSHIKLVLKRKSAGTFKVTLNTSSNMADTAMASSVAHNEKHNMVPNSVCNDSVGKNLQSKSKSSPKKAPKTKRPYKKKESPSPTKPTVPKKKSDPSKPKKFANSTHIKKRKLTEEKGPKQKSNAKTNPKKKSPTKKTDKKSPRKEPKSKAKTKSKTAQTKSKKKKLICSIGVQKDSTKSPKASKRTTNRFGSCFVEEFHIKNEPADDGYESSIRDHSQTILDADLYLGVKLEPDLPSYFDASNIPRANSLIKEEENLPCRYLYDDKQDEVADGNYYEHAIAWGLKSTDTGKDQNAEEPMFKISAPYSIAKRRLLDTTEPSKSLLPKDINCTHIDRTVESLPRTDKDTSLPKISSSYSIAEGLALESLASEDSPTPVFSGVSKSNLKDNSTVSISNEHYSRASKEPEASRIIVNSQTDNHDHCVTPADSFNREKVDFLANHVELQPKLQPTADTTYCWGDPNQNLMLGSASDSTSQFENKIVENGNSEAQDTDTPTSFTYTF